MRALQATRLWRIVKQDFPDWYAERLKEAAAMAAENKDQAEIGQHLARALVGLRRQNAKHALAADVPQLKSVARTFYENLAQLRKHSSEACFALISQGEASPVDRLPDAEPHARRPSAGANDGRVRGDRRWAQEGAQLSRAAANRLRRCSRPTSSSAAGARPTCSCSPMRGALARASPEKVCQLVHDWFAAHFEIKDPDMQLRLLVETIKPVVGG